MMLPMMDDMKVAMKMMRPKMMAIMREMKAGRRGRMMKKMVQGMQDSEHDAMMRATVEEMMEVMMKDMMKSIVQGVVKDITEHMDGCAKDDVRKHIMEDMQQGMPMMRHRMKTMMEREGRQSMEMMRAVM